MEYNEELLRDLFNGFSGYTPPEPDWKRYERLASVLKGISKCESAAEHQIMLGNAMIEVLKFLLEPYENHLKEKDNER